MELDCTVPPGAAPSIIRNSPPRSLVICSPPCNVILRVGGQNAVRHGGPVFIHGGIRDGGQDGQHTSRLGGGRGIKTPS